MGYKIGIEFEKCPDNITGLSFTREMNKLKWTSGCDGDGVEWRTPPLKLNITELDKYFRQEFIKDVVAAKATARSGGHIHISSSKHSPTQLYKLLRIALPLLSALYPARSRNGFCNPLHTFAHSTPSQYSKGDAFTIHPSFGTLEIRIFPAVKGHRRLMFRLKLIELLLDNPFEDHKTLLTKLKDPDFPISNFLLEVLYKGNKDRYTDLLSRVEEAVEEGGRVSKRRAEK